MRYALKIEGVRFAQSYGYNAALCRQDAATWRRAGRFTKIILY